MRPKITSFCKCSIWATFGAIWPNVVKKEREREREKPKTEKLAQRPNFKKSGYNGRLYVY